jgi:hypothetical protein
LTLSLALTLSAALGGASLPDAAAIPGVTHETRIKHRGAAYQVTYAPQVTTRMRTVGVALGARPSTQRCRWWAEVQVKRLIRRDGTSAAHERLLPAVHRYEGSRVGSCGMAERAVQKEQMARLGKLDARLAELAAADRVAVVADIDAAHALAAN